MSEQRYCRLCEQWLNLDDLTIVATSLDAITAIDASKRAHTFQIRDRRRPPTPKPEPEVLVVTKDHWKFTPPVEALADDDELAKLVDAVLQIGDTDGN
jgi:hypothetical protein